MQETSSQITRITPMITPIRMRPTDTSFDAC